MKKFSRDFVLLCTLVCVAAAGNPAPVGAMHPGERFIWPVCGGTLIKGFGFYSQPYSFHTGVDIKAPKGTAVKAAAPGKVLFAAWLRGYGQVVIIAHGREYATVYAHLSTMHVKKGDAVISGAMIGSLGDTGTVDGYHLHFEVREGSGSTAKDPLDYLTKTDCIAPQGDVSYAEYNHASR